MYFDETSAVATLHEKVVVDDLGIDFREPMDFEEWASLASRIGRVVTSIGFVVGDWLVYGEDHFQPELALGIAPGKRKRVENDRYQDAVKSTGLDFTTLKSYVYVCRRLPRLLRHNNVSFEHHRKVAAIKDEKKRAEWLSVVAHNRGLGQPISTRRLARSINAGRLLTQEEAMAPVSDPGFDNIHPHVNRIVRFWATMKERGWLANATKEEARALIRDLEPIMQIRRELEAIG